MLALLTGCGAEVRLRIDRTRDTTILARARGAYECAPVALAKAEAYAELAKIDLAAGELMRAESELELAETQAKRALADAGGCLVVRPIVSAPPPPPPQPPPPPLPPAPLPPPPPLENPDRDGDGVPDGDDRCPDVAGEPERGGCPAPKLIVVKDDKIELKQKIHFASGKSTILPDSFPLLAEIVEALRSRPQLDVRIEGHTDSRGSARLNTGLSRARAEAVRVHLVAAGIDGKRLAAVGLGPSQPIADNRTAVGREENRRVEFFLLAR